MVETKEDQPEDTGPPPKEASIGSAASRALAEAALRRKTADRTRVQAELGGRGGLEPVRFGDWEVNGLASDF